MISMRNAKIWIKSHPILKNLDLQLENSNNSYYSTSSSACLDFLQGNFGSLERRYCMCYYQGKHISQLDMFLWMALQQPHEHPFTDAMLTTIRTRLSNSLGLYRVEELCANTKLWLLNESGDSLKTLNYLFMPRNVNLFFEDAKKVVVEPFHTRYAGILATMKMDPELGVFLLSELVKELSSNIFNHLNPNFWQDIEHLNIYNFLYQKKGLSYLLKLASKESKFYVPSTYLNLKDVKNQEILLSNIDKIDYRNRKALYQSIAETTVNSTEKNIEYVDFLFKFYKNYEHLLPVILREQMLAAFAMAELAEKPPEYMFMTMLDNTGQSEELDLIIT